MPARGQRPAIPVPPSLGVLRFGGCGHFPIRCHLGLLLLHMIAAPGGGVLTYQAAQRPDIRHELPDLVIREFTAKGRHAVRTPLDDGGKDVGGLTAVNPLVVHQRRGPPPPPLGTGPPPLLFSLKTPALR